MSSEVNAYTVNITREEKYYPNQFLLKLTHPGHDSQTMLDMLARPSSSKGRGQGFSCKPTETGL